MKIPTDIIKYVDRQWRWDDDLKQEVLMRIMELPDGTEVNKSWCCTVYNNLRKNKLRNDIKQADLRRDNHDLIVQNLNLGSQGDDPAGIVVAEENATSILIHLSPLLRATAEQHYVQGKTAGEIATEEGVDIKAVYERLRLIRNKLKGEKLNG